MEPSLYKALASIAITFLILGLIVLPFQKPGTPTFYADLLGIILLAIFIALLTIYYHKTKTPIPSPEY